MFAFSSLAFHYSARPLGDGVCTLVGWNIKVRNVYQEELSGIRTKLLQMLPDHIPSNEEERDRPA